MQISNQNLFSGADMSQATLTSPVINCEHALTVSVQAVFTGSPVGALKLQASQDQINWDDISGATLAISTAGHGTIPLTDIPYRYLQIVYTKTSGTGSLSATSFCKGV